MITNNYYGVDSSNKFTNNILSIFNIQLIYIYNNIYIIYWSIKLHVYI